ncbi:MAG: hypothetical protein AAF590_09530 [Pseudomonadota bacterium]
MSLSHKVSLIAAAILWVIWGLVHAFAGILVLTADAIGAFQAITDAIDPSHLAFNDLEAVGGILNQHDWSLLWFGLATIIGAVFIWRKNMTAIWVTVMVGGLVDLGYLSLVHLPGYLNVFPGPVMTFISSAAIALSFWVWLTTKRSTKFTPKQTISGVSSCVT